MQALCSWLFLAWRLFSPLCKVHVPATVNLQAAAVQQRHRKLPAGACRLWDHVQSWDSVWNLQEGLLLWKRPQ
jgi:hypothetical protein